uniref:Ribonuclease H-like domain-containing protein n=1 Tax=Tanacetum cinerariifolium TaxID=118510 RepID=A0A6L2KMD9_TANCI|nr:ribonuclease H-like domain-containing protein [Tanacetum cinerariifolium]
MLLALEDKNKTSFIDGSSRRSSTDEVLGRQWDRVNALLMKVMQFLVGLDDYYMQIRSSILSREVLPGVRRAYAVISSEESDRIASCNISESSQRSQIYAFIVKVPNRENYQKPQTSNNFLRPSNTVRPNDNGNRRTSWCSNLVAEKCGFNGHTIDRCFKIIGYPVNFVINSHISYQIKSIGKGVQANMAGIIFNTSKDLRAGNFLRTGRQFGGLYYFDGNQDLNHLNFFDFDYLNDHPEMPNNKERSDPNPNRHGTPSPHYGSIFKPLNEKEGGHSQGLNAANVKSANHEDNHNIISEGDKSLIQPKGDVHQDILDTQNLRRTSRPFVFLRNYNDFVVDSKAPIRRRDVEGDPRVRKDGWKVIKDQGRRLKLVDVPQGLEASFIHYK